MRRFFGVEHMKHTPPQENDSLAILSDIIPTQIWEMADTVNYGRVNAAHAAFLGRSREDAEHRSLYELLDKAEADLCVAQNKLAFEGKRPVFSEEWAYNANRERRLLRIVKTPKLDENGNVLFLSCSAEDVTEQHLLAEQNRRRERILNAIVRFSRELFSDSAEAIPQGLSTLGAATQVDRVYYWENRFDEAGQRWLTSQRYEWVASGVEAQIDNPDLQDVPLEDFSNYVTLLRKNKPFLAHVRDLPEEPFREMLAAQQILSILVLPVFLGGVFMGFVGFDSCVREREWTGDEVALLETFIELLTKSIQRTQMQQELTRSKQNFDNFFSTIDDLLFVLNYEGIILGVNQAVVRKTGYSREELIGRSVLLLHPAERRAETEATVRGMVDGTLLTCRIPIETKDGLQFPVITRVCKGEWNGTPAIFGVIQDTTLLDFSAEKYSKAFENTIQMMAIIDTATGAHIDVNDVFCRTLGYERSEVVGKTPFELELFALPEEAAQAQHTIESNTSLINSELTLQDKEKNPHIVLTSVSPVRIATLTCLVVSMLDISERKRMERELQDYNENLEEIVQEKVQQLADALWGTITALVFLAESRDDNTGGHLRRISETCRVVATALSLNSVYSEQLTYEFIVNLQQACLLHDIGKVGIRDSILLKRGKLTTEEFDEMKKHTTIGAQTLESAYQHYRKSDLIKMGIEIALSHHERWDGLGYPTGLKGNEIPLAAQIVAICDVYDALRSTRCYKTASSHEDSLIEIRRDIGHRFNPVVAKAFLLYEREIEQIYQGYDL